MHQKNKYEKNISLLLALNVNIVVKLLPSRSGRKEIAIQIFDDNLLINCLSSSDIWCLTIFTFQLLTGHDRDRMIDLNTG